MPQEKGETRNGGNGHGGKDAAPGDVAESVRARRFELVDENGTVRALLGVQAGNGAPGFLLADDKGRPRVALHVSGEGSPAVDLLDAGGVPRLHAGLDGAGAPAITLYGTSDNPAQALFSVSPEGSALVRLAQGDGKTRLFFSIQADGTPYVSLMDADGQPKLSLALPGGNPALLMLDRLGKPRAVVSVTADEGPQFAVLGDDGGIAWSSRAAPMAGSAKIE